MKIVVLDKSTLGNDLDYNILENEGNVVFYDITSKEQTIERIIDADIVVTNKVVLKEEEISAAKKLKLICVAATGYNNIDIQSSNKHGIFVTNVKGYSTDSVVQQIFAYLLAIYTSVFQFQNDIKAGKWQNNKTFTMLTYPIFELKNKKIGIIGYGTIGKKIAQIAHSFGMIVLPASLPNRKYTDERYDFEYVLKNSDIISINVPLTSETKDLICIEQIKMMKKTAIIINYARGGIVNEKDLAYALKNYLIKGAIVDVLTEEPPSSGNPLFEAPNIFLTPHTGWTSFEARTSLLEGIVNNIKVYKNGDIEKIKISN